MIKILQVLPSLNVCGGVENYLMNYYTHFNNNEIKCDFCVHSLSDDYFKNIIEKKGDKIYVLPSFTFKNLNRIKQDINKIFKEEKYDIIHCHQANAAYFYFKIAKRYNINCRILHSHQSKAADKFFHALRNYPLLLLGKKYSTSYFACSDLAGKYLFGKNYKIINNAVDIQKFAFNDYLRSTVRNQYSIPKDAFVVGHIGRMCPQKNQAFLLDIFAEIIKKDKNSFLFLIGDGEDRQYLFDKAKKLGIYKNVLFTGSVNEPYKFYSAMDVFVLPSVYEGLPVVGVEAQCNGLPMVVSENVTQELKLLPTTRFVSLKELPAEWAKKCLKLSRDTSTKEQIVLGGYEINTESEKLIKIYKSIYSNSYVKI